MTTKDAADEAIIKQISDLALLAALFGYEAEARAAFDKAVNFAKMFGPKTRPEEQSAEAPVLEGWIEGMPSNGFTGEIEVRLRTQNATRTVRYESNFLTFQIRFTDCTHPAQNAACNPDDIVAWRPKP